MFASIITTNITITTNISISTATTITHNIDQLVQFRLGQLTIYVSFYIYLYFASQLVILLELELQLKQIN